MLLIRPGAIPRRYGTLSATTLLNDLLMPEQLAPELLHPKCAQDRGGGFDEAVQGSRSLFPPCCTHRLCDRCPGPECSSPSSVCGRANERRRYKRRKIAVVFNKPMAPASINAGALRLQAFLEPFHTIPPIGLGSLSLIRTMLRIIPTTRP